MKKNFTFVLLVNVFFALNFLTLNAQDRAYKQALEEFAAGNDKKGLHILRTACSNNDAQACFQLGILYSNFDPAYFVVATDLFKAAGFYEIACDGGVLAACNNLGVMHYKGDGVRQDYAKALQLYDRACQYGDMDACNNIGVMFENGYGVQKRDFTQAGLFYTDACMGKSAKGCYNLAILVLDGKGIKKDRAQAKEYFGLACDFGYQDGCEKFKELNLSR